MICLTDDKIYDAHTTNDKKAKKKNPMKIYYYFGRRFHSVCERIYAWSMKMMVEGETRVNRLYFIDD